MISQEASWTQLIRCRLSALALGRLHMGVSDVLKLFDKIGDDVVTKPRSASIGGVLGPRFDKRALRTTLQDSFAEHIRNVHGGHELRQPNEDSSRVYVLRKQSRQVPS